MTLVCFTMQQGQRAYFPSLQHANQRIQNTGYLLPMLQLVLGKRGRKEGELMIQVL